MNKTGSEHSRRILLMGNPNVGKSVFFSRLTGVQVVSANYPGTTIEFTKGYMLLGKEKVEIIDVPGTYTLQPTCKAEEVACEMIKSADIIINIVDATNLERNLYLTLELMEQGLPVIVALNMWDDTKHKGIEIDIEKLANWLGVPVVSTVALTGQGFSKIIAELFRAKTPNVRKHSLTERWEDIGKLISQVQKITHRHHTFWEILEDLSIHPISGIPIAIIVAIFTFIVIRFIGEGIINYLANPFFESIWRPILIKISGWLGAGGLLHDVLIGKLISGQINYIQSFGVLSTAVYIEFAMVLPYLIAFYFILGLLEDSGYLPRVAILLDGLMHKVGLHGFAIIPTFLGLGCNVPGILATRVLDDKRERFIAATLISIGVPCAALQAMIIGILGKHGAFPVLTVYLTLFISWLIIGFILNKLLPGFSPELLMEIPPYHFPPIKVMFRKLWWRIKGFITEAFPIIVIGVFFVNLFYTFGIFDFLVNITAPLITGLWGLPKEAVMAIVIGFLRKDVAVGLLLPLNLTIKQLTTACVVLSMFFPCIATFTILFRELGWKDMLKSTAIMIASALIAGYILNLLL